MSGQKTRAAVIGLGRHGQRHAQAYQRVPGVELVALCDVRPDQVSAAVEQYSGAHGYTEWQKLFESERPDIVSVVTNGPSHAPITLAAARAGVRHVLCEKPMATAVSDAREMIKVCRETNTRLAVCHARRWVGSYQLLRSMIADGLIGKPAHFWFSCGGGLFAGNGTHFMDLARMLSDSDPISVTSTMDQAGTPNPRGAEFHDPGAVALYHFANGMRLVIDMYEDLGVPPRMEIVGSIGRILIDEMDSRWEIITRQGADREQPVTSYWLPLTPVPFVPEALDMVEMLITGMKELLGGGDITCTGADGLASLEMVIGAHVSSGQGGAPVSLPLQEDHWTLDIPLT